MTSTLDVYDKLKKTLVASPARAHCVYNLHDLSRVFAGLSLLSLLPRDGVSVPSPGGGATYSQTSAPAVVIRLWCHEVSRTFADRLLTNEGSDPLNFICLKLQTASLKVHGHGQTHSRNFCRFKLDI